MSFLFSLSETGNKLEWGFVRAVSVDQPKKGLSHLRVVCFTFQQIFLTQIIIHEVFILIISYITRVISHAFQKTCHDTVTRNDIVDKLLFVVHILKERDDTHTLKNWKKKDTRKTTL